MVPPEVNRFKYESTISKLRRNPGFNDYMSDYCNLFILYFYSDKLVCNFLSVLLAGNKFSGPEATHRQGIRASAQLTSWFPCGPQEAYCSTAFSLSGG